MRRLVFLVLFLLLEGMSLSARALTLREAYELALAQSEQLKITETELRAAEARYREVAGDRWPELRAEGGADFKDEATGNGDTEEYRAGIGASWNIFQGFRTLRSGEARQREIEAAAFTTARYRELLYQDVADIFYQALAVQKEVVIVDEEIAALDELVRELDQRMKVGRSRKAEWLSARAQAANQRIEASRIRGSLDASLEMLSFLTGREKAALTLTEEAPLPDAAAMNRALESRGVRADISAAELSAEAAKLDTQAAAGERNINVSADGNFYVWQDPDDDSTWDVMIRAELPLFDGGTRRAGVATSAARAEAQELRLSELRRIADRDTRMAATAFETLLGQWAAMQDAMQVTSESLAVQRSDYDLGRASNLDVLTAMLQEFNMQRRSAALEMQIRASLVRLQVAAGGATP